jgi:signal transduction histidine kinase
VAGELIENGSARQWLLSKTDSLREDVTAASERGVDLICVFDESGQYCFRSLSPNPNQPVSCDELLGTFRGGKKPIAGPNAPNYQRKGILSTPLGALFCASIPYIAVQGGVEQRGILLVGSFWTKERAGLLPKSLMADFTCTNLDEAGLNALYKQLDIKNLPSENEALFYELGGNLLQTYLVLKDFEGRPALLLRIDSGRDLLAYGRKMVYLAGYIGLGAAFIAIILIAGIVQMSVISPITQLIRDIVAIGRGERIRQGRRKRRDEIGKLAEEFDHMLELLDAARKKLVEKSYISGMAEMSSGILHNARNALSPLVSGIERLQQQISSFPVEHLQQANHELQKRDLPDQRREDLARFLCLAGENIFTSMTTCQNHLHELVGQVYQIEEMLNGQKTFRGAERPLEIAEPKKLIEESIQLMPAALREKVRIIVDSRLEKLRPIRVHRVVFLQVVENLLINAAESIRRAKPLYPKICVRGVIEESDSIEMLHLEIQDNGAGIETEKLSSIFEGGNSSKPRGLTGIGLHWCANTISAMKGKIWAHSDGPGKGACFHILLPVSQEREMLTIKERRYTDE